MSPLLRSEALCSAKIPPAPREVQDACGYTNSLNEDDGISDRAASVVGLISNGPQAKGALKGKLWSHCTASTRDKQHMGDVSQQSQPIPRGGPAFDNSPNARSTAMKTVDGAHTYGRPNQRPTEHGAYNIGVAEDVGARRTMEDAYSFVVDYAGIRGQGFFAVFDGHAGKHAAEWCGQHFHEELLIQLVKSPDKLVPEVIADTFSLVDAELTRMSDSGATSSGCTAVTAFLRLEDAKGKQSFAPPLSTFVTLPPSPTAPKAERPASEAGSQENITSPASRKEKVMNKLNPFSSNEKATPEPDHGQSDPAFVPKGPLRRVLYTANAGDARAVLARQGTGVRLTYDHKGNDRQEVRRIQEAGGFVLNNRVNGVLAVTRSLGDSAMKDFVVGSPYTSEMELSDSDKFLIVACDGLWDVVEDKQAVELIEHCTTAQQAAEILVRHALDNFSHDNVTVLVVKFGNDKDETTESATVTGTKKS